MELLNATKMQAGYTMGMAPDGRESLVVVVKGTFRIPEEGREPELAEEQVPLVMADVFAGSLACRLRYMKLIMHPRSRSVMFC